VWDKKTPVSESPGFVMRWFMGKKKKKKSHANFVEKRRASDN